MLVWRFKGGIHPPTKKLAKDSKIENLKPSKTYSLFVAQNSGNPPKLIVQVGSEVKTGQKIAEADGFVSVPLHSPVTGKVIEIKKEKHPVTGRPADIVVIERTSDDEWVKLSAKPYTEYTPEEIKKRVAEAGIVGLGGATFPTHVKLSPSKKVDTVILNGAECEPYLTIDQRMMVEYAEEICKGGIAIAKSVGATKIFVGIEENKPDAIESMKKAGSAFGIEVVVLPTKYPQGSEKHLIYAITKKQVPSGGLPMDVGVVVDNVSTARAIYRALEFGEPLIERGLTLTGEGVKNQKNVFARIGTPISDLLDYAEVTSESGRVILGGPMTGVAVESIQMGISKGTSGITVLPEEIVKKPAETNCIRCYRCVEACPTQLEPYLLYKMFKKKMFNEMKEAHLMDCIECGSCAYVCPANIDHVKAFKTAKLVVRTLGRR
ncbi:electron transport complex subunit RsxC [Athalassotoga saccharophila]|uniref:electron transport complex subunit RsxC n=1 Tax=Athalassotoga saccharophila TaxID=1441386 RepID=UPI00137AD580|nr:electron transport complex subunit RsxC [Athalassotoga saccharophila]BBJ27567.1 electron transport complex protein RnfC [Athalassotoga saccharophila]